MPTGRASVRASKRRAAATRKVNSRSIVPIHTWLLHAY
jgi:hypothetical protein